jgi:hypothetical protein
MEKILDSKESRWKIMTQWIQKAVSKMKKKGTLGSFGKATSKKIAAAKKKGGKMAKKAIFAQNMKRFSGGK